MRQRTFSTGRPLSPVEIEREILRTLDLLEIYTNGGIDPDDGDVVASYERLGRNRTDAEAKWKLARGRAALKATGRNDFTRQAQVDVSTDQERKQAGYAEAVFHSRREMLETLRNTLDALRTMSANVRHLT